MKARTGETIEVPEAVITAVRNQDRVDEAPHSFYRYPARFSPVFAREAIKAFTSPGETVLDGFCGGGTSLVEAIAMGRRAVGFDISSLATFLTRTKTTPLSIHDKRRILEWSSVVAGLSSTPLSPALVLSDEELYYRRNLPDVPKAFFETILSWAELLSSKRQQSFVRLVLLNVGQWALDCKTGVPNWLQLNKRFTEQLSLLLEGHYEFLTKVANANEMPRCRLTQLRRVINRSSEESDEDGRIPEEWLPAKLVLTSPPYPGVHVVYHRWQIHGRKETPAPFWLAHGRDGAGAAHYCLGRRDEPQLETYFSRLKTAFSSIRSLVGKRSIVAQLVAFSDPDWQLNAYLEAMNEAGYSELLPHCDEGHLFNRRLWRKVPGRKWYASQKGNTSSSEEVLLFHRLA